LGYLPLKFCISSNVAEGLHIDGFGRLRFLPKDNKKATIMLPLLLSGIFKIILHHASFSSSLS
jgi:hypothetical protein